MSTTVRVPGFLPTINGLHFANRWPPGTGPDYAFNVLGQTIKLGDASNGLCGGMVYTVKDLFDTGLLPPVDTALAAEGSPLFNYLVARLTHSFDEDDVNQYLSWIQMSDHDTGVAHGLAWHEISEEWPKIKGDLDAGSLSPLGLVHGQEPPTVGFFTGMQDLGKCHQVLAWGYDLDGSNLTIHIYDPDSLSDLNTVALDIADPEHTTPIPVSTWDGFFRGFFRTHYAYHDPRTPVSAALIATVVSSPGITSAGSIPSKQVWSAWADLGGGVTDLATTVNPDGRIEVFAIGTGGKLFHIWQTIPGGPTWSAWADLGGGITKLATTVNSDGRIEVFAIGIGKELFHIWQATPGGPAWSAWADLGGGITKLATSVNVDGRIEVFAIGLDQCLYHIWQMSPGGTWSPWAGLGGGITELATVLNRDGRIEVFAIGLGHELFHIWQTTAGGPAWSTWADLGGSNAKLATAVNKDGRVEVFAIGLDKSLYHIWQTSPGGPWSPWAGLGGGITELATALNRDGRIEVSAIGIGKELFHTWQMTPTIL
jgi:acylphosphatase